MTSARQDLPAGNSTRFAARPLSLAGTATNAWRSALTDAAVLDLSDCTDMVVVAAHPDDETFGFGAAAASLAARGVPVQVVAVSDGGASRPGLGPAARRRLSALRYDELHSATESLGLPAPIWLGVPDGQVGAYEGRIADLLGAILAERSSRTWCAANWRGDGHPDHEAVGRAAAAASARHGAVLLEYPVWMWHWADVGDPAVPWDRLRVIPANEPTAALKDAAVQCYRSQTEDPDVLPPFVLERLLAIGEVVFG